MVHAKTMTSVLPVPCPPTANDPATPAKPAEANATTRETDQPRSATGKGPCQGEIRFFEEFFVIKPFKSNLKFDLSLNRHWSQFSHVSVVYPEKQSKGNILLGSFWP